MTVSTKAVLLASLTLAAGNALAVNTFWTGNAGDHRWNNAANWSPAHIPNSSDAVYIGVNGPVFINANEIGVAASLSCTSELVIGGHVYVNGNIILTGHTVLYGTNPGIQANSVEISGQFDMYSGSINRYTQGGTTHIASGGSLIVQTGSTVSFNSALTVDGRFEINDSVVSVVGDADYPIGFIAGEGGTIAINGNSTLLGNAYSYLASDGAVIMSGSNKSPTITASMKFFNGPYAVLRVEGGAHATINNPAQITNEKINSGYWYIKDNSTLLIPDFRSIATIEGNGRVILEGPGSQFYNLSRLTTVTSSLSLRNGASLSTNPFGGTFNQHGYIELSAGSILNVDGAYDCSPTSYTHIVLNGLTAPEAGTIFAQSNAHLGGTLVAQFSDNFNPFQNTSVDLITTGSSGTVTGAFTPISAYPSSGHAIVSYTPHTATLTLSCRADLNSDGFVDDSDFVQFVYAYNILDCTSPDMLFGCPADLNNDTIVDDSDFVIFVAAYDVLLCD